MTDQSKIIARIKALIAKAESTEHAHEAEAFMAKANQLLQEHQIDLGSLIDSDDPVIVNADGFEQTDSSPSWYKDLYVALGGLYGCKAVKSGKLINTPTGKMRWGYAIELTGRESAIVTTQLMFPWVKAQCFAKGRDLAREFPGETPAWHARRVGNALVHRIWALVRVEQRRNETTQDAISRNALVTIDQVEQVYNDHYGELGEARSVRTNTNGAAREAANSIGLHRQAGQSDQLRLSN